MRVYGALLWSLGKTMSSPEVARVYVGSFWDEPLKNLDNSELFEQEERDLMKDLAILPRQSAVRKINELPNVFRIILKKYGLSAGDFPDINKFSAKLSECKFSDFNSLSTSQIDGLDDVLNVHIPKLMEELPSERDTPDTLRAKMGETYGDPSSINVPMPTRAEKFGKGKNEAA